MQIPRLAWFLVMLPLAAQEGVRNVDRPGEHTKHLTTDTVDLWRLEAPADEILRVVVSSGSFDPVIELVRLGEGDQIAEVVVPEVDDDGSSSALLARVATAGRYGVRVHGPGNRGGGNYRFWIERFRSLALPQGAKQVEGQLDEDGLAHVRFVARKGQTIAPFGQGAGELIDPMGHALPGWEGCCDIERDGEHYLRVRGQPRTPFRAGVEVARRRAFAVTAKTEETLGAHALDEWTISGKVDQFRTLVVRGERIAVRITTADDKTSTGLESRPLLRYLPMSTKGMARRFAFVLGRDREYRVQIRSQAPEPVVYRLNFGDPSIPLAPSAPLDQQLPVGDSHFFTFDTAPGQVLRVEVESTAFDPVLRLWTRGGQACGDNDDGGTDLASRLSWLVTSTGMVRAQVASFGDGGGGSYRIQLVDVPVPDLPLGTKRKSSLGEGSTEHWHFEGRAGQTLFLSARSSAVDTALVLFDPAGVEIGKDEDGGGDRNALFGIRLPRDGRYTLAVSARSGRGEYALLALDPDSGR